MAAKEAVSQVTLQKEVLEDEKMSLAAALSKVAMLSQAERMVKCLKGVAVQWWLLWQPRRDPSCYVNLPLYALFLAVLLGLLHKVVLLVITLLLTTLFHK